MTDLTEQFSERLKPDDWAAHTLEAERIADVAIRAGALASGAEPPK
ncbi:hypothetical protein [Streptomyces hirsutus]